MDGEHAKNMALKATYVAVRLTACHPLSGDHFNTNRLRCFAVLNGDFVSALLTAKPPLEVSLYLTVSGQAAGKGLHGIIDLQTGVPLLPTIPEAPDH